MQAMLQGLRYAVRQARNSPGFAITVLATLTLGYPPYASTPRLFDSSALRRFRRSPGLPSLAFHAATTGKSGNLKTPDFSRPLSKN